MIITYRALHAACHRGTDRFSDRLNCHPRATALQVNTIYIELVDILMRAFTVTSVRIRGN